MSIIMNNTIARTLCSRIEDLEAERKVLLVKLQKIEDEVHTLGDILTFNKEDADNESYQISVDKGINIVVKLKGIINDTEV